MSFDMYKTKYLKYKKKYLELQDLINKQFAGAAINQCIKTITPGDLYPDISSTYNFNNLNNFFTNHLYTADTQYSSTITPPSNKVNIRFRYYNSITNTLQPFHILDLGANPRLKLPVQPDPPSPPIPIIKGGPSDSTTYIYYYNSNGIKINGCPLDEIHLTESYGTLSSIIGKNFGLKCEESINSSDPKKSIISDLTLNNNKKILIIDWQNIINNLLGQPPINPTIKTDVHVKFNFFLYDNIVLKNNYVFIIFKKSIDADIQYLKDIINGPYDLKSYIRNSFSKLQIIITSIANKYLIKPKPITVRNNYTNFTNINFESNYKIIWDDALTSSYDDFVFWVVVVFTYNLIRNKINTDYTASLGQPNFIRPTYNYANLEIYTLDKQKLDINCQENTLTQNNYYEDITNVDIPRFCYNNPKNLPNKNLFNIVYPSLNIPHVLPPNNLLQLDMNNPSIYCYFLNFNSTTNPITEYDNSILPNNWYYSNDKLLNIYINFILKLFGNTPIKLNPKPNNFTFNAFYKINLTLDMNNYKGGFGLAPAIPDNNWVYQWTPLSYILKQIQDLNAQIAVETAAGRMHNVIPLNAQILALQHQTVLMQGGNRPNNQILFKHYNQSGVVLPPDFTDLQNNIEPIVALYEKFNTNNLRLESLRTDTINFFFNNFPFEGTGVPNGLKALYQVLDDFIPNNTSFDFANKGIHPGLFFYAQVKHIQNNFYGSYNGVKDNIQERMGLLANYQGIQNDNTKKINKIKNNLECEKKLVNKIKSDKLNCECDNKRLNNTNQLYYQEGSQLLELYQGLQARINLLEAEQGQGSRKHARTENGDQGEN